MHSKDSPNPTLKRFPSRRSGQSRVAQSVRSNVPTEIGFPHPLSWWRTRTPQHFKEVDIYIARHVLSKSAIIGEPYWYVAASGSAPIAINVARRVTRSRSQSALLRDVAMTAVLCVALEGNVEARLFLAAMLSERSQYERACAALSDGWLSFESSWG
jgi:hypothetical protein